MGRAHGGAAAAGFGLTFLLAGIALLLQELGLLTLQWSLVLPLTLVSAWLLLFKQPPVKRTEITAPAGTES